MEYLNVPPRPADTANQYGFARATRIYICNNPRAGLSASGNLPHFLRSSFVPIELDVLTNHYVSAKDILVMQFQG